MEHRKLSLYLKTAGVIAALGGLFVFLVELPLLAQNCRVLYPNLSFLFWPMLIFVWVLGALYASALWQYMLICHRIGKNQSFCPENVKSMFLIAKLFAAAAILAFLGMGAWLWPGLPLYRGWAALLLVSMASLAVGVLAWALGKLLQRATVLQEENDLTI